MSEDLKWSNYDFSKISFHDIFSMLDKGHCCIEIFLRSVGYLVFAITGVATVGLTQEVTEKIQTKSSCVPQLLMNPKTSKRKRIPSVKKKKKKRVENPSRILGYLKYLANDVENTNYTSIHMTSNCSRKMKWFQEYTEIAKAFSEQVSTASLHTEHVNILRRCRTLQTN